MTVNHVSTAGMAPETLGTAARRLHGDGTSNTAVYNEKADLYQYGTFIYEVLTNERPFKDLSHDSVLAVHMELRARRNDVRLDVRMEQNLGADPQRAWRTAALRCCTKVLMSERPVDVPVSIEEATAQAMAWMTIPGDWTTFMPRRTFLTRDSVTARPWIAPVAGHPVVVQLLDLMDECLDFDPSARPRNFASIAERLRAVTPKQRSPAVMTPLWTVR